MTTVASAARATAVQNLAARAGSNRGGRASPERPGCASSRLEPPRPVSEGEDTRHCSHKRTEQRCHDAAFPAHRSPVALTAADRWSTLQARNVDAARLDRPARAIPVCTTQGFVLSHSDSPHLSGGLVDTAKRRLRPIAPTCSLRAVETLILVSGCRLRSHSPSGSAGGSTSGNLW